MQRSCQAALHDNHMVLAQCEGECSPHLIEGSRRQPVSGYVLHPLWLWKMDLLPKRVQMNGGW